MSDVAIKLAKSAKRLKDIAIIVPGAFLTFAGYSIYEGNEKFYREYVMPFTHKFFDAETAHRLGVLAAKYNIVPRKQKNPRLSYLVIRGIRQGVQ